MQLWPSPYRVPVRSPVVADLLLASNRGPVSYAPGPDGALVPRPGGGGLVAALASPSTDPGALWVCAAMGDGDRLAVGSGLADLPGVLVLDVDAATYASAYDRVANSLLWPVAHLLCATSSTPVHDAASGRDWDGYVRYCGAFADALARHASPGAAVLVQDYHLALVPAMLRDRRPDLRTSHFSHTPWAPPEYFQVLPDAVAGQLLRGMLGADALGFLSRRWADAFGRCCAAVLGAAYDGRAVVLDGRTVPLGVHPLGVDGEALRARGHRPDVEEHLVRLRGLVGDRRALVRVDRAEPSKNIVRGLLAYRELLRTRPQWRGRVVHLALAYPSRTGLADYRDYTADVQRLAAEVEEEFGRPDWRPVLLEVEDDRARALAALRLADVLLVNPVRDGMNLVAKEGPVLSDHGVALVLSREAGAADELGEDALVVNPYDVGQTAAALHEALSMPDAERAARSARLAARCAALPPGAWLEAQRAALTPALRPC